MCGRFALFATSDEIVSHFHLRCGFSMKPRYNIAPTQLIPAILPSRKQVEFFRWGFVPTWQQKASTLPPGHINARAESLTEKPTFKNAFKTQRCLIPASGYYEWRTFSQQKQPYFISLPDQPLLAFAGIWSTWQSLQGEKYETCAIVTVPASEQLQRWHPRMPAIIAPPHFDAWLAESSNLPQLENLMIPAINFTIQAVTSRMSNPRFEGAECIRSL